MIKTIHSYLRFDTVYRMCLDFKKLIFGVVVAFPLSSFADCDTTDTDCTYTQGTGATITSGNSYDPGTLGAIAENITESVDQVGALLVVFGAIMGAVIIFASLHTLWKSTKDDRERPVGAIIGLLVGGLLFGFPGLIWRIFNSIMAVAAE